MEHQFSDKNNMKRMIVLLILALFSLSCVFSATKKKEPKPKKEKKSKTQVEKVEETPEVAAGEDSSLVEAESEDQGNILLLMPQDQMELGTGPDTTGMTWAEKQAAKKEYQRKQREKTDEYTGHVYTVEKKPVIQNDFVRVEATKSPGTFMVYAINRSTKEKVNILSNYEQAAYTYFSLMYGKSLYQLNKSANVIQELRQTDNSVQVLYRLPNKARVLIDFKPVNKKSEEEYEYIKGDGVVKVCIYATNLGARQSFLGVKGVFDTYLGENAVHFKTAGEKNFDTEAKFIERDIEERQWVLSENMKNSVQFLFFGKGITTPESVFLGNRDGLCMPQWNPPVVNERSFNSVLNYNNSAIGINWTGQFLEKNETLSIVFYIASTPIKKIEFEPTGADNPIQPVEIPENAPFVDDGLQPIDADGTVIDPDSQIVQDAEKALADSGYVRPAPQPQTGEAQSPIPSNYPTRPQVEFVLPPITKEKLDPVYIQQLIDRIYSLQNDPQLIDRSEIRRLNAELDSILMTIRRQRGAKN